MNAARTSAFIIYGVRRQKMRNETYSEKDLEELQRDFMAIPVHVRYAILGRVIGRVVERLVVWERRECIASIFFFCLSISVALIAH